MFVSAAALIGLGPRAAPAPLAERVRVWTSPCGPANAAALEAADSAAEFTPSVQPIARVSPPSFRVSRAVKLERSSLLGEPALARRSFAFSSDSPLLTSPETAPRAPQARLLGDREEGDRATSVEGIPEPAAPEVTAAPQKPAPKRSTPRLKPPDRRLYYLTRPCQRRRILEIPPGAARGLGLGATPFEHLPKPADPTVPTVVEPVPEEFAAPHRALGDPDSAFETIDGTDVHFKFVPGAGSGPVFVLMHGFASSLWSWREVQGELAAAGSGALALDRPAFGLTRCDVETGNCYTRDRATELTAALLERLGLSNPPGGIVLVGHSAGANYAVDLARRLPRGSVRALVLLAPVFYSRRRLGLALVRLLPALAERALRAAFYDPGKATGEVLEAYRRPLRAAGWDAALYEHVRALAADLAPHPAPHRGAPRRTEATEGALRRVEVPVLLLSGSHDRIAPPGAFASAARAVGESRAGYCSEAAEVPRCGHLPHEERPEAVLAAVRSFLASRSILPPAPRPRPPAPPPAGPAPRRGDPGASGDVDL
eukprot:tig00001052_g6608.t1